jgi:hypothetical protein
VTSLATKWIEGSATKGGEKSPDHPTLDEQGENKDLAKEARKEAAKSKEQFKKDVGDVKNLAIRIAK